MSVPFMFLLFSFYCDCPCPFLVKLLFIVLSFLVQVFSFSCPSLVMFFSFPCPILFILFFFSYPSLWTKNGRNFLFHILCTPGWLCVPFIFLFLSKSVPTLVLFFSFSCPFCALSFAFSCIFLVLLPYPALFFSKIPFITFKGPIQGVEDGPANAIDMRCGR